MISLNDNKSIGWVLCALGVLFDSCGVLLFLDKGLMAMGNILFLAGMTMAIGVRPAVKFFTRPRHRIGSVCFLGGATLIILSWTLVGFVVQLYGFWRLFASFFPTVLQFARQVPYVSTVLDWPVVKNVINRVAPASGATLPY